MDARQVRRYIVRETLQDMGHHSAESEELLMGILAQESDMGYYIDQAGGGNGPAYGPYQMEEATYQDVSEYLRDHRPDLWTRIIARYTTSGRSMGVKALRGNFYLSTAYARAYFLRYPAPIPPRDNYRSPQLWADSVDHLDEGSDLRVLLEDMGEEIMEAESWAEALAVYWKVLYNTEKGKGTVDEFVKSYQTFVINRV